MAAATNSLTGVRPGPATRFTSDIVTSDATIRTHWLFEGALVRKYRSSSVRAAVIALPFDVFVTRPPSSVSPSFRDHHSNDGTLKCNVWRGRDKSGFRASVGGPRLEHAKETVLVLKRPERAV